MKIGKPSIPFGITILAIAGVLFISQITPVSAFNIIPSDQGEDAARFDVLEPLPTTPDRGRFGILEDLLPPEIIRFFRILGYHIPGTGEKDNPAISPGLNPAIMACAVPGATGLGRPFVGTHSDCKSWSGGALNSGSWQSENGSDWKADPGTPILAVVSGIIENVNTSTSSRGCAQSRFYLRGDDGNRYFYQHTAPSAVLPSGTRVVAGDKVGEVNMGSPCVVPHLHMAIEHPWLGGNNAVSCTKEGYPKEFYGQDPVLDTWNDWFVCCTGDGIGCNQITPPPGSGGGGGGGGGGSGLTRPLPEPFSCQAPDIQYCAEPSLSQNPPGFSQNNCEPIDPTCSQGTCFGICKDASGNVVADLGSIGDINNDPNPVATLTALDPGGGSYCAYSVSDRCGDPTQGGACAFVLECETRTVCNSTTKQCEIAYGRQSGEGEVSCDSNADCVSVYSTCRGEQCVTVTGSGENNCSTDAECAASVLKETRSVCLTDAILQRDLLRVEGTVVDDLLTQIDPKDIPLGPQCVSITCVDENGNGTIDPSECPGSSCSSDTDCGLTEITPQPLPTTTPVMEAIICGDGLCDSGEENSCPIDCALKQDPLPPFPAGGGGGGGTGTVVPVPTCSDTDGVGTDVDGNGIIEPWEFYDSCVIGGESTILCSDNSDCTRPFRSGCRGESCEIIPGPGVNQCGSPTSMTDTGSLNDDFCKQSLTNTCGGKYDPLISRNPAGENFGDASCTFSESALFAELKRLDCRYANFWMAVAAGESGYNPNITAAYSTSGSAWGLFQMGHDGRDLNTDGDTLDLATPWIRPPRTTTFVDEPRQMNNQFDGGDTPWAIQAFNAVSYNNRLRSNGNEWCYWSVAKNLLGRRCRIEPNPSDYPSAC